MKSLRKYAITFAIVSLVGASFSGAALAHGKGGKDGKGGYMGGTTSGTHMFKSGKKGGCHKGGGMHLNGGIHSQKYLQLLVTSYAPDLKSSLDALMKSEKEIQTQYDAIRTSGAKIDRSKFTQPDQATIDARTKAHEAMRTANQQLSTALEADKTADIATALKAVIAAKQSLLTLEQAQLDALKKALVAPSTTPSTTSPSASPAPAKLPTNASPSITLL